MAGGLSIHGNRRSYGTDDRKESFTNEDEGCCNRRTGCEKTLLIFVAILSLGVLALSVALAIVVSKNTESCNGFLTICNTTECQQAAKRIKSSMNETASPCDNFYEYACGGWMRTATIPDDRGSWGIFDDLRVQLSADCVHLLQQTTPDNPNGAVENSRSFFQLCVATENVTKNDGNTVLKSVLNETGGAPIINNTIYNETVNWLIRIANVRKLGVEILLSMRATIDEHNPESYIIYLDQPSAFGLDRTFLLDLEENKKYVDAYKSYIRSTLCLLNDEATCPDDYQQADIQNIINFESRIANLTKDPGLRRDPNALYVKMSISQLQENTTGIPTNWTDFINDVTNSTSQTINGSTFIVVSEEEYLKNMIQMVNKEDPKTVANYIVWRLLQEIGPYSTKDFRANQFQFEKVTKGIQKAESIDDTCFSLTNDYYGFAVGLLYIQQNFSKEAKTDMEGMEKNLVAAFRTLLNENTWMDSETKKQAAQKLSLMVPMIGYPEWIENKEELNKYYDYLNSAFVKGDFIRSLVNVFRATSLRDLGNLEKKANRTTEWISQPSIVNAFYNPQANTITFPAGILQPPFYQHNTLNSLNFGGIGHVIGHEITHGFDDQGCEYNGVGKLESWWTNETKDNFNTRKKCFVDEYSAQFVTLDNNETMHLKGNQTIGENIADNGGVREAYRAYMLSGEGDIRLPGLEYLNHKKLFFLAVANIWCSKLRSEALQDRINNDPHSPGQFRATIPLLNTDEFAEVFECKNGSTMNPDNKCVLW